MRGGHLSRELQEIQVALQQLHAQHACARGKASMSKKALPPPGTPVVSHSSGGETQTDITFGKVHSVCPELGTCAALATALAGMLQAILLPS